MLVHVDRAEHAALDAPLGTALDTPLDTDVAIETPEHIVFRHRVAGPARRLLAYLLDLFICYGVFTLIAVVVFIASVGAGQVVDAAKDGMGAAAGVLLVLLFAIQWVYFAALEGWRGPTPGTAALVLSPPARPDELAQLPAEVRLDPDERQAIEMFLRRRDRLGRAREFELAALMVPLVRAHSPGLALADPSRALALLYDRAYGRAANAERRESLPPSLP